MTDSTVNRSMESRESPFPFCSIVLPAFNEAKHIAACLKSLENQTYPSTRREVIVVDNGSSDGTVEIARAFASQVHVVPAINVGAVRNFGAQRAKGEVLVFLDSDCVVDPDWLSHGVSLLSSKVQSVIGGALKSGPQPSWVERFWLLEGPNAKSQQRDLMGSCIFIRRADFFQVDGFNERLPSGEDTDLSIRLKEAGYEVIMAPELAVVHLGNPSTVKEFVLRQIWHAESYFLQPRALLWDRVFLLMLAYSVSLGVLLATVAMGKGYPLSFLFTQIAPGVLSIKRITRTGYRVTGLVGAVRILALDNLYLIGRSIGCLKSLTHVVRGAIPSPTPKS